MSIHSTEVGNGPIQVVFMHGLFGQGKNWQTIAKSVGDLATSHLMDLPNHGRTSWTVFFDYDEQADIIADAMRDRFEDPVVLVGHSMGGKIAMRLAINYPELVQAMMAVDISPARNESALGFTSLVSGLRSLDLNNVASRGYADRALKDRIPDDTVRRFLLQNLHRSGDTWGWMANLDMLGDELHAISGWTPIDGSFDGPAAWVIGGDSDYVKPEHEPIMREHFPAVEITTIPGAGHWVHSEAPDAFTSVLRDFLKQLP